MANAAEKRMAVEEYLAFEETAVERHEFFEGRIHAMGGGTYAHGALSGVIGTELRTALRGRAYHAQGPSLRVKSVATGLYTYADALVVGSPQFEDTRKTTLLNPRVIVEVLSESSEAYDRSKKFAHYRSIESLSHYVLVSTWSRLVEVYSRAPDSWELRICEAGASIPLPAIEVTLSLDAVYEGVELDLAPLPPPRE